MKTDELTRLFGIMGMIVFLLLAFISIVQVFGMPKKPSFEDTLPRAKQECAFVISTKEAGPLYVYRTPEGWIVVGFRGTVYVPDKKHVWNIRRGLSVRENEGELSGE